MPDGEAYFVPRIAVNRPDHPANDMSARELTRFNNARVGIGISDNDPTVKWAAEIETNHARAVKLAEAHAVSCLLTGGAGQGTLGHMVSEAARLGEKIGTLMQSGKLDLETAKTIFGPVSNRLQQSESGNLSLNVVGENDVTHLVDAGFDLVDGKPRQMTVRLTTEGPEATSGSDSHCFANTNINTLNFHIRSFGFTCLPYLLLNLSSHQN